MTTFPCCAHSENMEAAFSFDVLIICESAKEIMCLYEQAVLDLYRATFGANGTLNVMAECINTHLGVKRRPETIARMSASQKGRKKTPEQIEILRKRQTGFRHSDESRKKMSLIMQQRPQHPNAARALNESRKSPLRLMNLRASLWKRPPHSAETKQKISKTLTGKKSTPEANAKRSAAMKGRKRTPEEIERRVASRRAGKSVRALAFAMDAI